MATKYGYFSQTAYNLRNSRIRIGDDVSHAASIYKTPDGSEVMVTCVGSKPDPKDSTYMWDDAVLVGEVTEWVRSVTA